MQNSTKKIWDKWEIIAIKYLQKKWYKIIETNFKFSRFWEIDIITEKKWYVIFFEIKYRNSTKFWIPEESIIKTKLKKCKKTIDYFCKKNNLDFEKIKFNIITILKWKESYKLIHYKNIEL